MEELYTIEEASEILNIPKPTIYSWIKEKPEWFVYAPKAVNYVHFFLKAAVVEKILSKRAEAVEFVYKLYEKISKDKNIALKDVDEIIINDIKNFYSYNRKEATRFFKWFFFSEELGDEKDFLEYLKNKYMENSG